RHDAHGGGVRVVLRTPRGRLLRGGPHRPRPGRGLRPARRDGAGRGGTVAEPESGLRPGGSVSAALPTLREMLDDGRVHVADGAVGTVLYSRGVFVNVCYDALAIEAPEQVAAIH